MIAIVPQRSDGARALRESGHGFGGESRRGALSRWAGGVFRSGWRGAESAQSFRFRRPLHQRQKRSAPTPELCSFAVAVPSVERTRRRRYGEPADADRRRRRAGDLRSSPLRVRRRPAGVLGSTRGDAAYPGPNPGTHIPGAGRSTQAPLSTRSEARSLATRGASRSVLRTGSVGQPILRHRGRTEYRGGDFAPPA